MPLVDYGSSDESSSDENEEVENKEEIESKTTEIPDEENTINGGYESDSQSNVPEAQLFSKLPTPKNTFSIPDNTFKLLSKRQRVKIVLPSLNEIMKSTNEDDSKKQKPSMKGSGLFALLPAPKHSQSLVPDAVKKAITVKSASKKPLVPSKVKTPLPSPLKKTNAATQDDDEDDDDIESSDKPESFFFTSTDDIQPNPIEPMDIPNILENTVPYNNNVASGIVPNSYNEPSAAPLQYPESSQNVETAADADLDAEAIEKLCGASARKRKGDVPEEIIDINVDSMVGDAYMWLSKDLTKEKEHSGFKKAKNLSVTERRKHQITYLASQAKEKEMELRNQWANSRMTRKQTQSKYGF